MTSEPVTLEIEDDVAIITLDAPNSSANVLNPELFDALDRTFDAVIDRDDLLGILLVSAKPRIFVAGADLKGIWRHLNWPDERIIRFCEDGRSVMRKLSQTKAPTCAAIHGACVGGGLELTLWCDYRIAASASSRLGLPEVRLGLVPGWAGTVRLPRIANLQVGLELVTSARLVNAATAKEMGLVDHVVPESELRAQARDWLRSRQNGTDLLRRRQHLLGPVSEPGDLDVLERQFTEAIRANRDIHPTAPEIVLRHMLDTSNVDHDAACDSESRVMAQVWGSPENRGLLNVFFLDEFTRKNPGPVDPETVRNTSPPQKIGILGAGTMGRGIARLCISTGLETTVFDTNLDTLQQLAESVTEHAAELTTTQTLSDFADCDLIIESVPELFDVKVDVLRALEQVVSPEAVIATNTSALTLERLATALQRNERFCGIHFCHPQLLQLIEVVRGKQTDESAIARALQFVRTLRKTPIVVKDSPGFVLNRLLTVYLDRAFQLVARGNSFEEIDQAMRDFGFLAGPFEVVDLIGADVCLMASRAVWFAGMRHINPTPLMPKMVKQGWLGRKTGSGFYQYPPSPQTSATDAVGPSPANPDVHALAAQYQVQNTPVAVDQIALAILAPMAQEALRELDEQLVADYRHIDVCIIKGLGFPAFRGGILFWADQIGWNAIADAMNRIWPDERRMRPTDRLQELARKRGALYPQPEPAPGR